jgi:hypothetical protein
MACTDSAIIQWRIPRGLRVIWCDTSRFHELLVSESGEVGHWAAHSSLVSNATITVHNNSFMHHRNTWTKEGEASTNYPCFLFSNKYNLVHNRRSLMIWNSLFNVTQHTSPIIIIILNITINKYKYLFFQPCAVFPQSLNSIRSMLHRFEMWPSNDEYYIALCAKNVWCRNVNLLIVGSANRKKRLVQKLPSYLKKRFLEWKCNQHIYQDTLHRLLPDGGFRHETLESNGPSLST